MDEEELSGVAGAQFLMFACLLNALDRKHPGLRDEFIEEMERSREHLGDDLTARIMNHHAVLFQKLQDEH